MYNKNTFLWLCAIVAVPQLFATQPNPQSLHEQNQSAQAKFWENKGQIKDQNQKTAHFVKFGYESGSTQVFLLETGLAYQFSKLHYPDGYQHDSKSLSPDKREANDALREKIRLETFRMDMQLVDANPNPRISREGKSADYMNYYNHNVLGVYGYEKVTYHEIYQGIDWVIYTNQEGLKYDFVLHPNADIRNIKMRFEHQEALTINPDGSFTISNPMGTITEQAPISFQNGKEIATRFMLNGNELSFSIANYDSSQPLTIDPNVLWATYYGGNGTTTGLSCTADASGNVYLAGYTQSANAIASGGHQNTFGGNYDAFLVKFNSSGVRQWGTYYSGNNSSEGRSCAVDASGNVYLAGQTNSTSGIASGGHQNTYGGGTFDAFLVKFNSSGIRQWGTYYGGANYEYSWSCAVDASGNVYLAGYTNSTSAIASGGHQNTFGGTDDAFLVKFNSSGLRQWGTYYGGIDSEGSYSCVVDASDNVYLAGQTSSTSAIASGGHQNTLGGNLDAFLVKFNSSGIRQWGTYYGGTGYDYGYSCAVDASGNVYLAGYTESTAGIASGGHQNTIIGAFNDAFLVKFNSNGLRQWGTYYGGTEDDYGVSCAVDASGDVYLVGTTKSTSAIASGGHQNTFGGDYDAFLVKFNSNGLRQWGTYYGGTDFENGRFCAVDARNNVYLAGRTTSTSGIASGGHQNTFGGTFDAFLVKFGTPCANITGSFSQTICAGQSFLFNGVNLSNSGAYLDTLIAANGCDSFLTLNLVVQNVDVSVTNNGNFLSANNNNASYQWINCNENSLIINETNQTFTHNGSGTYAVIINENNCVDTSACITVTSLENFTKNYFSVFPNPSADVVNVTFSQIANKLQINLYSSIGLLVYTQRLEQTQQFSFSLSSLPPAIYWLHIQDQNGQTYTQKIVKE